MSRIDPGASRQRLERRYRRLLALYPTPYRLTYTDEMLGVLMEGAREGQRRPRLAESVNLVATAARLRSAPGAQPTGRWWFDAAAVFTVLLPILMLTPGASALIASPASAGPVFARTGMVAWGAAAVIVLCGLRWLAAAATWGVALLVVLLLNPVLLTSPVLLTNPMLLASGSLVEAAMFSVIALSLPGGAGRGLALLGWGRVGWFLAAGAVMTLGPAVPRLLTAPAGPGVEWWYLAGAGILTYAIGPALAITGGAGLAPRITRRFVALVAAGSTFVVMALLTSGPSIAPVTYLPSLGSWPRLVLPVAALALGALQVRLRERSPRPR